MKYWVTLHGHTVEVELRNGEATLDGRPVNATLESLPGSSQAWLTLDGVRHAVALNRGGGHWAVQLKGDQASVEVETERSRLLARARVGHGSGPGTGDVRAPMPGLVLRLNVEEGDAVESGDGLLVLEAMKMENIIKAGVAGRVGKIHVQQGAAVEKSALLVSIDVAS